MGYDNAVGHQACQCVKPEAKTGVVQVPSVTDRKLFSSESLNPKCLQADQNS